MLAFWVFGLIALGVGSGLSQGAGSLFDVGTSTSSSPTPTPSPSDAGAAATGTPTATAVPAEATATPTPTTHAGIALVPSSKESATPTSTPSGSPSPTPTKTPIIARSGLALFPSAYSNGLYRSDGFNLDILFSYFIGSIVEKTAGQPTETLNPLRLWLFTVDGKYGWLEEDGDRPGIASGMMDTLLLQGGNPTSTGGSSGSLKFTAKALGGIYTVVSKHVSPKTALHIGLMRGNISGIAGDSKTIKRFLPTGNFADLMVQFAEGLSDVRHESAPNILYTGCDFRWIGTTWRFELVKPFPLSKHPFMINSKIDRLFAFNLAYEHWDRGYAVLGYFNFRFTILPTTPKKPMPLQ